MTARLVVLTLTFGRLGFLVPLVLAITNGPSPIALIWVGLIIITDVFDGVVARRFGCDDDQRRKFDAVVDRITIHVAFVAAIAVSVKFAPLYLLLLVIDVILAAVSVRSIDRFGIVIVGGRWHGASSLSKALFGVSLLFAPAVVTWSIGIGAVAITIALALDYLGGYMAVREGASGFTHCRFTIRGLAGLSHLWSFVPGVLGGRPVQPDLDLSI